jgi:RNA polymerase-binding transcription factor DksA
MTDTVPEADSVPDADSVPEADSGPEARAKLIAERDRVHEQLQHLGHDGARDSFDENFADIGQVTAERGEVDAIVGSLLDTLDDVEHALAKLESGAFGACENCSSPIAAARLDAMPAARLCISCASNRR